VPLQAIHHVDLAVTDVERSLAFYLELLGPLGLVEDSRYATYRGTEEVVYLSVGEQFLGLRPSDGGEYRYYEPGVEHIAFYVDTRAEVDEAYQRCLAMGVNVHFPPEQDRDLPDFYELFVFDPDGIRVEINCEEPASD
jgi:catechol 2,3-dioxygenase-like lactoylglutathione lyase family enzyme